MKILIVRFSSIGDIVLTTPIVRCLKMQGEHEVHYIVKSRFKEILDSNPHIDKVWSFDNDISEIIGLLKKESFDHLVDLHRNLRSMRLKMSIGVKSSTFNKLNTQKWLLVNFKWNRMPDLHIVDRYFQAVRSLGIQNDGRGLDFYFNDHLPAVEFNEPFVCLVIGAAHATKQIPTSKAIEICNLSPLPIVLLGGKLEENKSKEIQLKSKAKIIDKVGKLSIAGSAQWINKSSYVITADTGMMHIAAALNKPMAVLWGSTVKDFGMTTYTGKEGLQVSDFEILDLPCRPCSKLGLEKCPRKHFRCMNDISASEVILTMKTQI